MTPLATYSFARSTATASIPAASFEDRRADLGQHSADSTERRPPRAACDRANAIYSIDDVPWSSIESASHLHLGGNDSMRGLGRDGAAQILRRARDAGLTTSMDILSEGSPKLLAILKPCLPFVDSFMPNANQACKLAETSTPEQAAIQLLLFGVGGVVLTMGGDGSILTTAHGGWSGGA